MFAQAIGELEKRRYTIWIAAIGVGLKLTHFAGASAFGDIFIGLMTLNASRRIILRYAQRNRARPSGKKVKHLLKSFAVLSFIINAPLLIAISYTGLYVTYTIAWIANIQPASSLAHVAYSVMLLPSLLLMGIASASFYSDKNEIHWMFLVNTFSISLLSSIYHKPLLQFLHESANF